MAKVPFSDLKIRVWMPIDPTDCCLAKIGDSPILFQGKTPGDVRRAASEWRDTELAKIEAQRVAAEDRAAKRKGVAQ